MSVKDYSHHYSQSYNLKLRLGSSAIWSTEGLYLIYQTWSLEVRQNSRHTIFADFEAIFSLQIEVIINCSRENVANIVITQVFDLLSH